MVTPLEKQVPQYSSAVGSVGAGVWRSEGMLGSTREKKGVGEDVTVVAP